MLKAKPEHPLRLCHPFTWRDKKGSVNGSTKPFFILWVFATNPHLLALSCNPASEGHSQGRLRPQTVIGGYEDKEHSLRVGEKTWIKEAFFSMSGGGAAFTHSRAEPTEYLGQGRSPCLDWGAPRMVVFSSLPEPCSLQLKILFSPCRIPFQSQGSSLEGLRLGLLLFREET